MIKLAVDEDFDLRAIRGLRQRVEGVDITRVWDILPGAANARVLEWAASESRVLLTRDRKTLVREAYARISAGQSMAGVIAIRPNAQMAHVLADLELLVACGAAADFVGRVAFLPFD